MKLLVNLVDFSVKEASTEDMALATSNSQHQQLAGYVIANIKLDGVSANFDLLHPDTNGSSGHVDVKVWYREGEVFFLIYQNFQKFIPSDDFSWMRIVFPTGAWSLVKVTLAIEAYLGEKIGFSPKLHQKLLAGLAK